jgi:hypothetical protein
MIPPNDGLEKVLNSTSPPTWTHPPVSSGEVAQVTDIGKCRPGCIVERFCLQKCRLNEAAVAADASRARRSGCHVPFGSYTGGRSRLA